MSKKNHLAEITVAVDAAGTIQTLRYASIGFNTLASDSPANTHYAPRIEELPLVRRDMFAGGKTSGRSSVGYGLLSLVNPGDLDALIDYGFDGRDLVIKLGYDDAAYSSYTTVFKGTMEQADSADNAITIRVKDRLLPLDNPLASVLYAGTNALPAGIEGTVDDIKGQPKPKLYGKVFNIEPRNVNTSKQIYQVNDGAIHDIPNCYDRGAALTRETPDYANQAAMEATPPAANKYRVCPSIGCFRLAAKPDNPVTCDVVGVAGNLLRYSEDLTQAGVYGSGNVTIGSGAVAAGTAYPKLDSVTETTAVTAYHYIGQSYTKAAVAMLCTGSCFIKPNGRGGQFTLSNGSGGAYVELSSTGVLSAPGAYGSFTGASASAFAVGGGVYLVFLTTTTDALTTVTTQVALHNGVTNAYTGTSLGVYAGGFQLRYGASQGAYAKTGATNRTTATVATQLAEIALSLGTPRTDIGLVDIDALDTANSAEIGVYVNDTASALTVMDQVAESIGAWFGFDNLGVLRMGRLIAPAGTPVAYLTAANILDTLERVTPSDDTNGLPTYRVTVLHQKNYTVQTTGVATSVNNARLAWLAEAHRKAPDEDPSIKTQFLTATPIERTTLLVDAAAAATEATRLLTLLKVKRSMFKLDVRLDDIALLQALDLGKVVSVTYPRYGFSGGKLMIILGMQVDFQDNSAKLTLWG